MSISKTNVSDFNIYVRTFIAGGEGFRSDIYLDSKNVPTIGYGFALSFIKPPNLSLRADLDSALTSAGLSWTTAQKDFIEDLMDDIDAGNVSKAESDLTAAYQSGGVFYGNEIDTTEGQDLFDFALNANLTTVRNAGAPVTGTSKTVGEIFQDFETSQAGSEELAAIYSMVYNVPSLFGEGIADAINAGDQARAWYEMLYHHTDYDDNGLMNRREAEADLFKLVADGATVEEIAAALNTLFNGMDYASNDIYSRIQTRDTHKPFETKIASYLTAVQDEYTDGNAIDYIQIVDGEWITGGTIDAKAAAEKTDSDTRNLIIGGDSIDTIDGKGGDDYSWSSVNGVTNFYNIENAIGSQYDDIFDISGNDNIVDGGEGIDAVHYYLVSDWDLDINLSTGFVDEGRDGTINDQLISIENAAGGYGNDNIVGNDGANMLNGYHGNDTLNGGDGDDELYGGYGDDTVHGGAGSDTLYGGDGNDDLRGQSDDIDYYYGEAGNDYLHGGEGDMLYGGSGDDVMRGYGGTGHFDGGDDIDSVWWRDADAGIVVDLVAGTVTDIGTNEIATIQNVENIIGTDFDDTITGDALGNSLDGGLGADVISGGDGADTIHGRDGADIIYGGDGDDLLYGDNDNDVLYGGDGFDKLRGQAGSDTFAFEASSAYNDVDLVYDFSLAENDKIDISDLLSGYDANNDVLSDFVQITDENNYSSLSIDADGGADGFVEIVVSY